MTQREKYKYNYVGSKSEAKIQQYTKRKKSFHESWSNKDSQQPYNKYFLLPRCPPQNCWTAINLLRKERQKIKYKMIFDDSAVSK